MADRLAVRAGRVALKNPLICGSGEHLMEEAGVRRALSAGAAAVVLKSTNESAAARAQLALTDYALLDSGWRHLDWHGEHPPDTSLFCRSGLAQQPFDRWLDLASRMDREAARHDAYVIASLIPADVDRCADMARQIEAAGVRMIEINVGAPHADEAVQGAIRLERAAARVAELVAAVRKAVSIPLWIKLSGQGEDIPGLVLAAREGGADAVTLVGRFMAFVPDIETMRPLLNTHAAYGGPWALPLTCHWLVKSRHRVGRDFPLIGTNGARSGLDIARFLLSGASAVQMSSAILVQGFGVVEAALRALGDYLADKQLTATQLIGQAADRVETYAQQARRPDHWREFVPPESLD